MLSLTWSSLFNHCLRGVLQAGGHTHHPPVKSETTRVWLLLMYRELELRNARVAGHDLCGSMVLVSDRVGFL